MNTEEPHKSLGRSTAGNYIKNPVIDNEDSSNIYLLFSTLNNNDYFNGKFFNKKVNLIQALIIKNAEHATMNA